MEVGLASGGPPRERSQACDGGRPEVAVRPQRTAPAGFLLSAFEGGPEVAGSSWLPAPAGFLRQWFEPMARSLPDYMARGLSRSLPRGPRDMDDLALRFRGRWEVARGPWLPPAASPWSALRLPPGRAPGPVPWLRPRPSPSASPLACPVAPGPWLVAGARGSWRVEWRGVDRVEWIG